MSGAAENREVVRTAIGQVCARSDMQLALSCYAEDFVDRVGRFEYRGLEGVERSTSLYRARIDNLAFEVLDQVAERDRVATRFAVTGANRGRRLWLEGVTLSRLRNGWDRRGLVSVRHPRAAPSASAGPGSAVAPRILRALRDQRLSGVL